MTATPCKECGVEIPSDADSEVPGFCPACTARSALQVALSVQTENQGPDDELLASPESFGDYEILSKIGQGGMGVVYKARQCSVNRIVALKMIRSGLWASDGDLQRFRLEAEAAARLQHPNIAAVYEAGECDDQLYYTMEYFEGDDLQDRFSGKSCPTSQAVRLVQKIAEGVHHAHQRGVLHRDLKPANILLDENDEPQITDFGLARLTDADSGLTMTHTILGSPDYLVPELADGGKGTAGAWSDVYGIGAIFYFLLTSRPPFQAPSAIETIRKVVAEEASAPSSRNPGIPRDLDTVCLRCLEKEPGRRYTSAGEVADELGRFLAGEPIRARQTNGMERLWRWCRRKPALASSIGAIMLVFILGTSGVIWQWRRAVESEQKAGKSEQRAAVSEQQALRDARAARRDAYTSRMLLAHQKYKEAQIEPLKKMLLEELPKPGQEDLRGFEWRYLYGLCHRDQLTINSFPRGVEKVKPSPDGKILAAIEYLSANVTRLDWGVIQNTIQFWDAATGESLAPIRGGETSCFSSIAFSPDGRFLAAGNMTEVEIWEVATRQRVATLTGHSDWIVALAYSPDGKTLASGGGTDQTVRIWDVTIDEPKVIHELRAETPRLWDLEFSPDGKMLAGGGHDGFLQLWNPLTGQATGHLAAPAGRYIYQVAFHPDPATQRLATAGQDSEITVWDLETGEPLKKLEGHTSHIYGLDYSPDGRFLVSGAWDNTVRVWETESGHQARLFRGHELFVHSARFFPDGQRVASASRDGTIKIWDLANSAMARTIKTAPRVASRAFFSNDGSRLLSFAWQSQINAFSIFRVEIWEVASGTRLFAKSAGEFGFQEFSPDLRVLPAGMVDGRPNLLSVDGRFDDVPIPYDKFGPNRFAWSPDGRFLACIEAGKGVRLYDGASGKLIRSFAAPPNPLTSLVFSAAGDQLAGCASDDTIVVWDVESGATRHIIQAPKDTMLGSFSPDGKRISFGDDVRVTDGGDTDYAWELWDLESQRPVVEGFYYIVFSPDGSMIATTLPKKAGVVIYDAKSLEERFVIESHDGGGIHKYAFSPDSSRIVTGSYRLAQIWDSQTGRELLTLADFEGDVGAVTFSPDGRSLVIGSVANWVESSANSVESGVLRIYTLPPEEKVEQWLEQDLKAREKARP